MNENISIYVFFVVIYLKSIAIDRNQSFNIFSRATNKMRIWLYTPRVCTALNLSIFLKLVFQTKTEKKLNTVEKNKILIF